jgi:uncharacterized membrane-anchored protein YitT (DUF2179 family)/HD superfamily phosphodiesterase
MQFEKVRAFIIEKLEQELPKYLTYHNVHHTREVLHHARHIAAEENVSSEDLHILLTAALFYNTGFLETYKDHEEFSCSFAKKFLPQFEYNHIEIEHVNTVIRATITPQDTTSHIQQILCDAISIAFLGTENYFATAKKLYRELKNAALIRNTDEWVNYQTGFIESHTYLTQTALREHHFKKEQTLLTIKTKAEEEKNRKHVHLNLSFMLDIVLIAIGVATAGFALKGFLVPNKFFDGGITGISLLIHELYHLNLAYVILFSNLPFIVLSMYALNYSFAIKTFVCIILLGLCLFYVPYPIITSDKLLISIFGGFFLGVGIGMTMRAGCAVDGIEVLALYAWKRTSFTISEIILFLNILIFSIAAFKFGIQTALYSMLTYFTASKTVDYVVEGIEAYTGVTIISSKSEIIKYRLVNELNRGITIYKGERGFLPGKFDVHEDCDIIFTVITRLELRKLRNLVSSIDPKAFVIANTIKEASGVIIKHRHI